MLTVQLSVVVIGLNEGARLLGCLRSAVMELENLGQTVELIYADSGSTDGSIEAAMMIPQVRVIQAGRHSAARARNAGWRAAHGKYVQFLDGDMCVEPGWFKRAQEKIEEPGVGAVFGGLRELQADTNGYCAAFGLDWNKPAGETPFFGGAVMVRREILTQVGGYDENLRVGEDPELSICFREAGYRILSVNAPMATHDLGLDCFSSYWRRAAAVGKSRVLVFRKNSTLRMAWRAASSVVTLVALVALLAAAAFVPFGLPVVGLAFGLRWARLVARDMKKGVGFNASFAHGSHLVFGKVPEAQGALVAFLGS